ncbi:type II toxin-antitoxin system HicB family antitoxin [Marinomonas sp. TW1]|uniref:type II toxin-antitoxin system HicB family antitoxin n=1 Tax=Marinomonas sp. TW1 TaxID=1561203 RepID=UPI0007AF8F1C|nr:type II toxin-antitoxin system HicB family antitoxin [Marinomonas sp. TW1]
MSKKYFEYKGYTGSIDFSIDDSVLFGKIEFINDLVNYEAATLEELKSEFILAVDDYLETCKEINKQPEKTMSGTFNVRVGENIHKKLAVLSFKEDKSINDLVKSALNAYLEKGKKEFHVHFHGASEEVVNRAFKEVEVPRWAGKTSVIGSNYQPKWRH